MSVFSIVSAIGSAVKFIVKPAIALANRAPSGTLTGLGTIVASAGGVATAFSGHIVTADNIVPIIRACAEVVTAIGTILIALGAQRAHSTPSA